jgi:hypothetical protein
MISSKVENQNKDQEEKIFQVESYSIGNLLYGSHAKNKQIKQNIKWPLY